MIQKTIEWYSVKEKKPIDGSVIVVFKQTDTLNLDFCFAIYHENWDGEEAFVDIEVRNNEEVRVSFEPDFWANLDFPV